jgi:hypothetical protein
MLTLARHSKAYFRAIERIQSAFDFHLSLGASQPLLGAFFGLAGALHIDFLRTFRSFGQNGDPIRQNLGKAGGDG